MCIHIVKHSGGEPLRLNIQGVNTRAAKLVGEAQREGEDMETLNIFYKQEEGKKSWRAARVCSDVGKTQASSPRGGGALLQRGGRAGSVGESTLGRHDQREGHTGFAGALAVGVGH